MDEVEEIRQRRLRKLQQAAARGQDPGAEGEEAADQASAQQEAAIERLLKQILEPEARERLIRIRMSRPDLHDLVIRQLVGLAQGGRLRGRLTDEDLRSVLSQLTSKDRDIRITRK